MAEQNILSPEETTKKLLELEAANKQLAEDNKTISAQNKQVITALTSAEQQILSTKEMSQKLVDLEAANKKLAEDNKTIQTENQQMLKALTTSNKTVVEVGTTVKAVKLPTQHVRIGMEEYSFQAPVFYHNGFYYTAEELLADSESESAQKVLADLIKVEGQGILKQIKK